MKPGDVRDILVLSLLCRHRGEVSCPQLVDEYAEAFGQPIGPGPILVSLAHQTRSGYAKRRQGEAPTFARTGRRTFLWQATPKGRKANKSNIKAMTAMVEWMKGVTNATT